MYAHYKRQHCPVIYSLDKKEASTSLGGLTVKIYWLLLGHSMRRKYSQHWVLKRWIKRPRWV